MIINLKFDYMELQENSFYGKVIDNLIAIMKDRRLTQAEMAEYAGMGPSQFSKVLSKTVAISVIQLSKIASRLGLREIDLLTYPDIYEKKSDENREPVEAILQIRLQKEKKDQVLKIVFGENCLEILNK